MLTREEVFRKAHLIGSLEERIKAGLKDVDPESLVRIAGLITSGQDSEDGWNETVELSSLLEKEMF
jgi:hypothetical protein